MRKPILLPHLLACGVLLGACAGNTQGEDPTASAPVVPSVPPPVVPTPALSPGLEQTPPGAQQLPISEDFEAEAEATIDERTYKTELDALSREIERDTPR